MVIQISQILSVEDLADCQKLFDVLSWRDGRETAGKTAQQVKQNLQADLSSRSGVKLREKLSSTLRAHPVLKAAAQPKRFSKLLISKTEAGGGYGLHVDNAFMTSREGEVRTDLSFTLFLSGPNTYEGGELVIEHAGQTQRHKPQAGDLVLYPSTSLHEVAPVTSGARIVCVGWIESRIKRADDRELLFDLLNLKAELGDHFATQAPELLILSKVIANLQRRFN